MTRDYGQCLTDETLTDYLEGSLDHAIKAASEVHLLGCEGCRDRLAVFMKLLQPEVTHEETRMLEGIAARWASNSGVAPRRQRKSFIGRWSIVLAAVAAALVVAMLSWAIGSWRAEPKSASEVVQLLLEQSRPFESRIADEPHHPILPTRGSDNSSVSYDLLASEMSRLAATSYEMGRFYLLQKNFARAIPYLEMSALEAPGRAAVHNDLGVAYLESGDMSQLQKAGQEFLRALQDDSSFTAAAFNLALFYERTNATPQAQNEWRRYLQLDNKTEWAEEARGRLQGLSH